MRLFYPVVLVERLVLASMDHETWNLHAPSFTHIVYAYSAVGNSF
jgi:hypothetical protein